MIGNKTLRQEEGNAAEGIAAAYLLKQGLSIVARNVRNRFGEIDIVAKEGDALIFVEVRYRKNEDFGGAGGSITPSKQKRMIAAAMAYLATLKRQPPCRFDAILMGALDDARLTWRRDILSI